MISVHTWLHFLHMLNRELSILLNWWQVGEPLVLLHMPTRVALLADPKQTEYTDFGAECEVVCQVIKRRHA